MFNQILAINDPTIFLMTLAFIFGCAMVVPVFAIVVVISIIDFIDNAVDSFKFWKAKRK